MYDTVRVTRWHGRPVEVRSAGKSQQTATVPTDGEFVRLSSGAVLVLGAVALWFVGVGLRGSGTLPEPDHMRVIWLAGGGALAMMLLGELTSQLALFPVLVIGVIGYPPAAGAFWYRRWSVPARS